MHKYLELQNQMAVSSGIIYTFCVFDTFSIEFHCKWFEDERKDKKKGCDAVEESFLQRTTYRFVVLCIWYDIQYMYIPLLWEKQQWLARTAEGWGGSEFFTLFYSKFSLLCSKSNWQTDPLKLSLLCIAIIWLHIL